MSAPPPKTVAPPPPVKSSLAIESRVGKKKQRTPVVGAAQPSFFRRAFLPTACASLFVSPFVSNERRMQKIEQIVEAAVDADEEAKRVDAPPPLIPPPPPPR